MGIQTDAKADRFLIQRMKELSRTAYIKGIYTYSDFLDQREISILKKEAGAYDTPFSLYGGYEGAERCVACFHGREPGDGYEQDFPIAYMAIKPTDGRFSQSFGHRDILGSVLGLGIERKSIGDIFPSEPCGLFCLERMRDFIAENFNKIRHTNIACSVSEAGEGFSPSFRSMDITISSNRLDAVIAAACHLSRSDAEGRISKETVFVNGSLVGRTASLREGDMVTVRGIGKFILREWNGQSKKGKLRARLDWFA